MFVTYRKYVIDKNGVIYGHSLEGLCNKLPFPVPFFFELEGVTLTDADPPERGVTMESEGSTQSMAAT